MERSTLLGIRYEFEPGICELPHSGLLTGIEETEVFEQDRDCIIDYFFLFDAKLQTPPDEIFKRYDTVSFFTQRGYRRFRKHLKDLSVKLAEHHVPVRQVKRWIKQADIIYQDEYQILIERSVYIHGYCTFGSE